MKISKQMSDNDLLSVCRRLSLRFFLNKFIFFKIDMLSVNLSDTFRM